MARRQNYTKKHRRNGSSSISSQTIVAICITAITILLAGGLFYKIYNARSISNNINKTTFCRKDGSKEITVVLVDHTDKINIIQQTSIENRLWDEVKGTTKNSLIKVFDVGKVIDKVLVPEISLCNPGDELSVNEITGNKEFTKKHFENKFKEPINKILKRIIDSKIANESPIMESIQSVVVTSFIGNTSKDAKKKLIIVSDILQHSKEFSLYKEIPDFEQYKNSSHWKSVRSNMSGVEVEIFFLHRKEASAIQTSKLRDFWINFFESQGATVSHFLPIEG